MIKIPLPPAGGKLCEAFLTRCFPRFHIGNGEIFCDGYRGNRNSALAQRAAERGPSPLRPENSPCHCVALPPHKCGGQGLSFRCTFQPGDSHAGKADRLRMIQDRGGPPGHGGTARRLFRREGHGRFAPGTKQQFSAVFSAFTRKNPLRVMRRGISVWGVMPLRSPRPSSC